MINGALLLLTALLLVLQNKAFQLRVPSKQSLKLQMSMSNIKPLKSLILAQGVVANGYGRGSKKLGFPTANLPHFDKELTTENVMNGVYYGWARIQSGPEVFKCVANIGKSPTFVGEVMALVLHALYAYSIII